MVMRSGPHTRQAGNFEASIILAAVFRLCGHVSGGPSGDADQSIERMSAPASPPPMRKSSLNEPVLPCIVLFLSGVPLSALVATILFFQKSEGSADHFTCTTVASRSNL